MLTSDLSNNAASSTSTRPPSSVSSALRAIVDDIDNSELAWDIAASKGQPASYRLSTANNLRRRERAYALAHRVYQSCGYVSPDSGNGLCVSNYDAQPETITLLADDPSGSAAGTISLVFDSDAKLPCDELYSAEVNALRDAGRQVAEVTRLVIAENHRNSKVLLLRLINFSFIYAVHVRRFTDIVIEVNPRHVSYYRRLLFFKPIGIERPCARVNGAPAVLLHLDLSVYVREVLRVGGAGASAKERTLYPHLFPIQDERAVAEFLVRHHKPMTADEARYFGLDPIPSHQAEECAAQNELAASAG